MYIEVLYFFDALKWAVCKPSSIGDGRALLAASADAYPIDPMIFQRGPDGTVVSGAFSDGIGRPPAVSIGMGDGYISLTGLGPEGVDLITKNAQIIGAALADKIGQPFRFQTFSGECDVIQSRPMVYRIPKMCLISPGKLTRKSDAYKDGDRYTLASVDSLIRRGVINGLVGQARQLDEQCGGQRESVIGTDDMLGIRVLDGGVLIAPVKGGLHAVLAKNLVIGMDLELRGAWFVGGMRSYGIGRVRKGAF